MIFDYKGTSLFYETIGKGETIVLLHGFLESSTMWKPLIPHFSKNKNIVTIDLPGHGKSGCISETHSMELMADAVFEILQYLNITEATYIGHSMGGYVILALAEKHPEIISKLVLLNSTTTEDDAERKKNRVRAVKILDSIPEAFISMAISNLFTEEGNFVFAKEIEELKKEALQFPVEGIKAALKGMKDRKDRTLVLKNFGNKKYIICGKQDPIVPFSVSEKIALDTNSELIVLDGGHMNVIENLKEMINFVHFID